jgi:hypothetical protein
MLVMYTCASLFIMAWIDALDGEELSSNTVPSFLDSKMEAHQISQLVLK